MAFLPLPSPAVVLAQAAIVPALDGVPSPAVPSPAVPSPGGSEGRPAATCVPPGLRPEPAPSGAPHPYRCPVPGLPAALFDAPLTRYSPGHRGIDLRAEVDEEVRAPASGVVSFAGDVAGRPVVTIDHGGGWRTSLEPVVPGVRRGDVVAVGQTVGRLSPLPGHCAPRACLHVGVRLGAAGDGYVDPLRLLRRVRVVLLPTG